MDQSMAIFTFFKTLKIFPSWQILGSLIKAQCFLGVLKKLATPCLIGRA